ncbi:MAG: hypothetical protein GX452_06945 [Ignavibacteriales bacterium]|jgi:hypothetical protein|nr:hypothetical protein [Ignavibacteriaceae bacterium]NLH61123.1 hypothetical protein [Ignavibacteriales bacterium]HOJ18973.1 hypothetical protein [Ignavibacteriaceae bacterium]
MKKLIVIILFLISATNLLPQSKGFGIGLIIGEPTGISAKYWTSSQNSLNFALGYSFAGKHNRVHLHVDYVWHNENLIRSAERLPVYYGFGGKLQTYDHTDASLGARGVLGLLWIPRNAPLDLFLEVAPVLRLIPETDLDIDAGLGARFFF